MTEYYKIIAATALTVLSGTTVFIVGQFVNTAILKPYEAYKETIGKVQVALIAHAREIHNGLVMGEARCQNASDEFRRLSGELISAINSISFYWILAILWMVPSKKNAIRGAYLLIGISNSVRTNCNDIQDIAVKDKKEIQQLLKFNLREELSHGLQNQ